MTIGIVCGLRIEAACLSSLEVDHSVAVSGGNGAQTEKYSHALIDQGATSLCSFGIAGGLDATLRSGDVVVATRVIGTQSKKSTPIIADTSWRIKLEEQLHSQGIYPIIGPVVMSDHVVASCGEKADLYTQTRGLCVDLETGVVARIAIERRVPFVALRVIADDALMSLPHSALVGIDLHGNMRPLPVLRSLIIRPYQLPALLRVALQTFRAIAVLKKISQGLVPVP